MQNPESDYFYQKDIPMETNWIIILGVIIIAVALIVYLILKNRKDEKEVTEFFNKESSNFRDDESEFNDER